jgi:hypothetical protein
MNGMHVVTVCGSDQEKPIQFSSHTPRDVTVDLRFQYCLYVSEQVGVVSCTTPSPT